MTYLELLFPCLGKKKQTKTNTPTPKSYFQDGARVFLLVQKKKKKASLLKAQKNG